MSQIYNVASENNEYLLELVPGLAQGADSARLLYRVLNNTKDKVHYKGISMSRTHILLEKNNGKKIEELFEEAKSQYLEHELLNDNEENKEIVINSDRVFWRELDADGGNKNE